jgi:hypothetical protein
MGHAEHCHIAGCVLHWPENQVYNEVKRICDCVLGIHSQVLVAANIKLGQGQGGQMVGRVVCPGLHLCCCNGISEWRCLMTCPT